MNSSNSLNRSDLDALDGELERFVPRSALSKITLERLLSHLLFLAEIGEKTRTIEKLDHAALDIAVGWAFQFCKPSNHRKLNLNFDESLFATAKNIYDQARHYEAVSGIMFLLYNGKLVGQRTEDLIQTQLAVPYDLAMAVAESELFGSSDPAFVMPDTAAISSHYSKCNRRQKGNRIVSYTFSDDLFQCVLKLINEMNHGSWHLDPSLDAGGYTLGHCRQFAESLAAFAQIHHYCNAAPPSQEILLKHISFNSLLKVSSRVGWTNLLSRMSGLEKNTARALLTDLTYEPERRAKNKPKPDLISTPFFAISDDLLMLSNRLAFESSWERNFWKLLSISKPEIHSSLSTLKEKRQIDGIVAILKDTHDMNNIVVLPRINVQNKTDLDLLILDVPNKFGLALQLKWPYGPAYYRDMKKVWEEFSKGLEKLRLTLPWLREIPDVLIRKSELSEAQLREFRFEAMLLSKNSIGFGWIEHSCDIPICSERFLQWALVDQKVTLQRFWSLSSMYSFKPKENVHYVPKLLKVKFGKIRFTAPTAFNVLSQFDPPNDVEW